MLLFNKYLLSTYYVLDTIPCVYTNIFIDLTNLYWDAIKYSGLKKISR